MSTHNICYYKEVENTDCNLKPTKLLDCALIGVSAVIRSNTEYSQTCIKQTPMGKPKTGCLRQVLA